MRTRLREMRDNALAARGACILDEAPEPSGLTGMADILAEKFPASPNETASDRRTRYKRMLHYIQRRYHYAVIAHEMGHSVGLRHNFVSQLGVAVLPAAVLAAPHEERPGHDPVHRRRRRRRRVRRAALLGSGHATKSSRSSSAMCMQSTVMDYPGDVSQDMIGPRRQRLRRRALLLRRQRLGLRRPELHTPARASARASRSRPTRSAVSLGIRYGTRASAGHGLDEFHYSRAPEEVRRHLRLLRRDARRPSDWNEELDGAWDPVLDGHVVSSTGRPTKCRQRRSTTSASTELRRPTDAELNGGFYRGGPSVDDVEQRTRVPYAFATDNWADIGNVSVFRHDNGADPYEQVKFLITTQENRHIFDNYRRNRTTFSVRGAADRSFTRYNLKLRASPAASASSRSIYRTSPRTRATRSRRSGRYIVGGRRTTT